MRLRADTLTDVMSRVGGDPDTSFAIARIGREREAATGRYLRDRDLEALAQTMARLDLDEAAVSEAKDIPDPSQALEWLRDLPVLWAAADDSGRRLLTEALFEKVEVLGTQSIAIHPTPEADAHGWSDAFGPVPLLLEARRDIATDGRGERIGADTIPIWGRVTTPPSFRLVRADTA